MKLTRPFRVAVALATLSVACITTNIATPASAASYYNFGVTLKGMAGGQSVTQHACLTIRDPGAGSNPLDVTLTGGNVWGTIPGAIRFSSNNGSIDTAKVTETAAQTSLQIDAKPISSAASYAGNFFVAGSSSFGFVGLSTNQWVLITSGDINFTVYSTGALIGFMNFQGTGILGYSQPYTYWAGINGTFGSC